MYNANNAKKTIIVLLLTVLFSCMFLYHLGDMALLDYDEPRYAESAREMMESHNWLIPYFNYEERLNKPILFYWLIISAYKMFGVNEFAARFWSAMLGILGAGLTYLFGKRIFNPRAAMIASIILATNIFYVVMARVATTDMTLTFFITASLVSFFLAYTHRAGYKACFFTFYPSLALGTLTKGPVAFIVPGLIIIIFLLLTKNSKKIFRIDVLWGCLLFIALTVPWYAYAYFFVHSYSWNTSSGFAFNETLGRFFLGYEHPRPVYYYIPIVLVAFFPWSCFLPFFIRDLSAKGWKKLITEEQEVLFILVWFAAVFLFFSLSGCKLESYILPLTPAFALVIGIFWEKCLAGCTDIQYLKNMRNALLTLAITSVGAGISALIAVLVKFNNFFVLGIIFCIIFTGLGLVSFRAFCTRRRWGSFCTIPVSIAIAFILLVHYASPEIGAQCSAKSVVTELHRLEEHAKLVSYPRLYPSSVFYSRQKVHPVSDEKDLLGLLANDEEIYCIIPQKKFSKLKNALLLSTGIVRANKKFLLISNKRERRNKLNHQL